MERTNYRIYLRNIKGRRCYMSTKNNNSSERREVPTSRLASDQERGVLALLRALAPRRSLNQAETEYLAELQANRLLELAGFPQLPIPNELITELPRIRVHSDLELPVSGSAQWVSGRWLLTINGGEPSTRQRFSLAHEFKHVIDHRHVDLLYSSDEQAEHAADFFAACLWMPKRETKRVWGEGTQGLSALSQMFAVSPPAMARRLQHLGLRDPAPLRRTPPTSHGRGQYFRTSTPLLERLCT